MSGFKLTERTLVKEAASINILHTSDLNCGHLTDPTGTSSINLTNTAVNVAATDFNFNGSQVLTASGSPEAALLDGRPGGQILAGSNLTSENLTLRPNSIDNTGVIEFGLGPTSYNIPATRGTEGQLPKIDNSGNVTWQNIDRDNQTFKEVTISTSYTVLLTDENTIQFTVPSSSDNVVILPNATTLPKGWAIRILNTSTSVEHLEITDNGSNVIDNIGVNGSTFVTLTNNSSIDGQWKVLKYHVQNTIFVSKINNNFNSVKDAMDSITDNTVNNRYNIIVGPGNFIEDSITIKPYVTINGVGQQATIITASSTTQTIIVASRHSSILNLTLAGASGSSGIGISMNDSAIIGVDSSIFTTINVSIVNCETCIKYQSTGVTVPPSSSILQIDACIFFAPFVTGLHVEGTNESLLNCLCSNTVFICGATCTNAILAEGYPSSLTVNGSTVTSFALAGNGINITNGSIFNSTATNISGFAKGLLTTNSGTSPSISVISMITKSNIDDLCIDHLTTSGVISGIFERSKTTILSGDIALSLQDPIDSGSTFNGNVFMGQSIDQVANVVDLISNGTMGLDNGGVLTQGGGLLEINVSAGIGYVMVDPYGTSNDNHKIRRLEWPDSSIIIPASTTSYIYFDNSGTLSSVSSRPGITQTILLGRVRTTSSILEFIEPSRISGHHYENKNYRYIREVFKRQYVTGSVVTQDDGGSREIEITNGVFYYSDTRYTPSGISFGGTFFQYNHDNSVFEFTSQTVVNNTQYDDGTGLENIPAGKFVKHLLYIVGDDTNERYMLVIGQTLFDNLSSAESGVLPTPPTYFSDGVTPIASFIINKDTGVIDEIRDERPTLPSSSSGVVSTSDHGELTGLLDDDHTQYILVDGSRSMTGSLNMGSQTITNAGTFNTVTVEGHSSRHGANGGADALSTAAPTTNIGATTSNSVGIQNTFSRSDHQHGLSTNIVTTVGHSGGTAIIGGTGASELLTLESTSNITKGTIEFKDPIKVDDIDTLTMTTLSLGKSTATKIEIADTSVTTEIKGDLTVLGTLNSSISTGKYSQIGFDVSVGPNSTTETSIINTVGSIGSVLFSTSDLSAGSVYVIHCGGLFDSNNKRNITYKMKLGSTTILDSTALQYDDLNNISQSYNLIIDLVIRVAGASGEIYTNANMAYMKNTTSGAFKGNTAGQLTSINLSSPITLDITFQLGTSESSLSLTNKMITITKSF